MINDRYGGSILNFHRHRDNVTSLDSLFAIIKSMKVRRGCKRRTDHADGLAFFIHHVKHNRHSLALFTHHIADTFAVIAEIKGTGGAAVNAHFAFDTAAIYIVRFSEFAFFIESDFGNHENGNAPRSFRIAFDSGQNRMNNIRGQILIAA